MDRKKPIFRNATAVWFAGITILVVIAGLVLRFVVPQIPGQTILDLPTTAPTGIGGTGEKAPSPTQTVQQTAPPLQAEQPAAGTPTTAPDSRQDEDFTTFLNRMYDEMLWRDPEQFTILGISPVYDYDNSTLTDLSPAYEQETIAMAEAQLSLLHQWDWTILEDSEQISYLVYEWYLNDQILSEPFLLHRYPYNYLFGWHLDWEDLMMIYHPLVSKTDYEAYLSRLEGFEDRVDQMLAYLEAQKEAGIGPPRFSLDYVRGQMSSYVQPSVENHPLLNHLQFALAESELPENEKLVLLDRAREAIQTAVMPGYRDLDDFYAQWQVQIGTDHGLSSQPNGEAAYNNFLRHHTTTGMTAREVHDLGLAEVVRITAEMDAIFLALDIRGESMSEKIEILAGQGGFVSGSGNVLQAYEEVLERVPVDFSGFFDTWPVTELEIIPFNAANAPGAYYVHPSLDGSKPGQFFVNMSGGQPIYGVPTLAYHEGQPGHHMQIALAQQIEGLPNFRRGLVFTAYAEGWALYAEYLALEAGIYDEDPQGNIGRLQGELFRAARLVTDTGLHAFGWSRQQAVDYMVNTVGYPRQQMQVEVDRYLIWPGQATAYKIGMLKIQELRGRAEAALGDDFDIIAFHNLVLQNGSLPLEILELVVDRWIES